MTKVEVEQTIQRALERIQNRQRIAHEINDLEWHLRNCRQPFVDTIVTAGVKLAWSGAKGHWRFVIIDEEDCVDLISAEYPEQVEIFETGAMGRLMAKASNLSASRSSIDLR